jgi:hypothetical protein
VIGNCLKGPTKAVLEDRPVADEYLELVPEDQLEPVSEDRRAKIFVDFLRTIGGCTRTIRGLQIGLVPARPGLKNHRSPGRSRAGSGP